MILMEILCNFLNRMKGIARLKPFNGKLIRDNYPYKIETVARGSDITFYEANLLL